MAEGVLEDLLGGGEEAPEAASEAAQRASAEAFAATLAADHAKHDPAVARSAKRFLDRQAHLLELQAKELVQQSGHRFSHLIDQSREGRLRRMGQRLRLGMQVLVALVVLLVVLGAVVMVVDAFTSRSVVVEAFKAPPSLAARGVTGEVVASDVLDTLRKLQAATRTTDKALVTRGAWASDVKIEVPETGVSIGEIGRLMHERFGHDLHIDGDLVQTGSGGLALTVRGDNIPASTFSGGPEELETLTNKAAEYVYGRSQPVQYGAYLMDTNRSAEAVTFIRAALPLVANDEERARLANGLGNAYSNLLQLPAAADAYRLSRSYAKPRSQAWWKVWGNLVGAEAGGRGEEAGWRAAQAMLQAAAAAPRRERPATTYLVNPAQETWDLPLMLQAILDDARENSGTGSQQTIDGPAIADIYALMHDPDRSARSLATSDPADGATKAEALFDQGYWGLDRGDAAGAVAPLQAFYAAWLADPALQYADNFQACFTGLALGLTGRIMEADAVFTRVGSWSLCHAFKGDVRAHAGDDKGARAAWAEGERLLPDLPAVPLHRGLYEFGRGELKAAEADIAAASAKAPHWADPLKAWGDVLAREGRWKEALAKYDGALNYAPAWEELHQARAIAARRAR